MIAPYPNPQPPASGKRPFCKSYKDIMARRDLSWPDKGVLMCIADMIGDNGSCWPSVRALAAATGLCADTINQSTRTLEQAGLVVIARGGFRKANRYTLGPSFWQSAACDPPAHDETPHVQPHRTCGSSAHKATQPVGVLNGSTSTCGGSVTNKTDPLTRPKRSTAAKTPPDPRVAEFVAWFREEFQRVRSENYVVKWAKECSLVKELLREMQADELKAASQAMFADPWGASNAGIGLLSSQINKWRGQAKRGGNVRGKYTPAPPGGPPSVAMLVDTQFAEVSQ